MTDYSVENHAPAMSSHFFSGVVRMNYDSVIRANIDKQNYSVTPRHWYVDAIMKCEACRQEFLWSAKEQRLWFEEYGFWIDSVARHCPRCRKKNRRVVELKREYDSLVGAARKNGTTTQKQKIPELVDQLEASGCDQISRAMRDTRRIFNQQIQKANKTLDG